MRICNLYSTASWHVVFSLHTCSLAGRYEVSQPRSGLFKTLFSGMRICNLYIVVQLHGVSSLLIDLQVHGGLCRAPGHGGYQIQVRKKHITNFSIDCILVMQTVSSVSTKLYTELYTLCRVVFLFVFASLCF
jgi:hypothetical protein